MGPTGGMDPNVQNQGNLADVKQAVAMMMEQQQANDPHPRAPTDQEAAQLKQKAMEMLQQKKSGGAAAGGQPPMGPPAAGGPPPPQGLPMGGPANVPPATGKDSANDALDSVLATAKAQTPIKGDVKPPGSVAPAAPGQPGWNQRIDSNISDIDKLLQQARSIQSQPQAAPGQPTPGIPSSALFQPSSVTDANSMQMQFTNPNAPMVTGKGEPVMGAGGPQEKPQASAQSPQTEQAPPDWKNGDFSDIDTALEQARAIDSNSPSGTFENFHPGQDKQPTPEVMSSITNTASKAFQAGIDSIDKAKVWLGNSGPEFKSLMDDPEYKAMLEQYEKEYNDAKARTDQAGPGVAQYIAAALLGLAGAHPQLIQSVLHGDQAKYQNRENLSGETLMQSRLKGLVDRQKIHSDSIAQAKLAEQDKIAANREAGMNRRADQDFNYKRLQSGRGENLKLAMEYLKAGETAVTHQERIAAAAKAAPYLKIENEYRKKLGEPTLTEKELEQQLKMQPPAQQGKPQGMAPQGSNQPPQPSQGMQQASMRLLGLGA